MTRKLISSGSVYESKIAYSRAIVDGDYVFVSGTTGFDYHFMSISENVVEQAVDSGILTSIITNGSGLDKLFNIRTDTIRKLSWIGVDIDSGDREIYEKVRRSKKAGLYDKVKETQ